MQSQPYRGPNPGYPQQRPQQQQQFAVELPAQWHGGNNPNGPANTGLYVSNHQISISQANTTSSRHELPEQYQNLQQAPSYIAPAFRQFSIPTDNDSLSSGFPYNPRLSSLRITPDQWQQFSTEVVNAAKLTFSEDVKAWGAGVGTGVGSSAFLLVFGPVVGYYTGKSVHKKTVIKKVKEKLSQPGELRNVFRQWNDGVFKERGLQAWLEPPTENMAEILVEVPPGASQKDVEQIAKRQARRFRVVIMPYDPGNPALGSHQSPNSPASSSQGGWTTNQSPTSPANGQVLYSQASWDARWDAQKNQQKPIQQNQTFQPMVPPKVPLEGAHEMPAGDARPMMSELDGSAPEPQVELYAAETPVRITQ
jgi:hypothetical protein